MAIRIKKDWIFLLVIAVLLSACAELYFERRFQPAREIMVYYNKDRALNAEIISLTRQADRFVYFSVYTFTRTDIKDALLAAQYRGLKVAGVTDRKQLEELDSQKEIIQELRKAGIPVYRQDHQAIMHTKLLVTDKAYASGSYNWTAAANDRNDEVLEVGSDEAVRRQYQHLAEQLLEKYEAYPVP